MRCLLMDCGSDGWLLESALLNCTFARKKQAHVALCKRGGVLWCPGHPKTCGLPISLSRHPPYPVAASTRLVVCSSCGRLLPCRGRYTKGDRNNDLDTIIHRTIRHLDGCVHLLCTCLSSFFILKSIIISAASTTCQRKCLLEGSLLCGRSTGY